MPPRHFKVFAIKLSPAELGAAIHEFDKDGDGTVSCPEFLLSFFRIGEWHQVDAASYWAQGRRFNLNASLVFNDVCSINM